MWLLATPIVIFVAHMAEDPYRREIFEIGEATCFFLGQAGLVALYALGGKDTSRGWFQRDTERVRRPRRSDAIGAPPLRDSFDDKKVPGDFDILQVVAARSTASSSGITSGRSARSRRRLRNASPNYGRRPRLSATLYRGVRPRFDQDLRCGRAEGGRRWRPGRGGGGAPRHYKVGSFDGGKQARRR